MTRTLLARAVGLALGASAALGAGAIQAANTTLTIFHNNDGESQLLPSGDVGGVSSFIGLLGAMRAANTSDAILTLSSGDNFLAGPEFNAGADRGASFDAEAWALIGYDALAIGNHEFDKGPDTFASIINDYKTFAATYSTTSAPFLSANLDVSGVASLAALEATGDIAKSTVVNKNGQVFGIIGATTPNLPFISSPGGVVVDQNVAGAVQAEIDVVKAGVDGIAGTADDVNKIIFISHLQGLAEDQALIAQLRGVDIAIAGGGDDLLANPGNALLPGDSAAGPYPDQSVTDLDGRTVPIVSTAGQYGYLGMLTVEFDAAGELVAIDTAQSGQVRNFLPDGNPVDATAQTAIESPVQAYVAGLATNVLATSEVGLNGVRDSVRAVETNLGNLIADAFVDQAAMRLADFGIDASIPLIGIQNGGGIRNNDIRTGDISELDTFDILPFGNVLSVVTGVTTQQLLDSLENAVSRVALVNGTPTPVGGGTGRFAQISGLSIVYDITEQGLVLDNAGNLVTPGARILSIVLDDGTVLVDNGVVVNDILVNIATLSFTAGGGDQYWWSFDQNFVNLGISDQEALAAYITGLGTVSSALYAEGGEGRITFVPVPAALPLMLTALGGLAAFRRRRPA